MSIHTCPGFTPWIWLVGFTIPGIFTLDTASQADTFPDVQAYFQGHCTLLSPCHETCIDLPYGGYECSCKPHHKLHNNGFSCIDETADPNGDVPEDALPKNGVAPPQRWVPNQSPAISHSVASPDPVMDAVVKDALESSLEDSLSLDAIMMGDSPSFDVMMGDSPRYTRADEDRRRDRERNRNKDRTSKNTRNKDSRRESRRRNRERGRSRIPNQLSDSAMVLPPTQYIPDPNAYEHEGKEEVNNAIYEHTKPAIKYRVCEELRCHAGGRCVPDEMRGGVRCQCPLGTGGELCEETIVVQFPKFMGTGYMAFPVLRSAYREFHIIVEFKPDTSNGLLLFSGTHPTAHSDFFSLSLVDGYAEFRFDCGTGMGQITTINQVQLGEWNTVQLSRMEWNGQIQLNDGPPAKGRSRGIYTRITFREDLYLGGFRNNSLVGYRTGMHWGFVGCVRNLDINNRLYDMRKGAFVGDAVHGVDVGECSSNVCETIRCHNGGTCMADTPDSHVCLCPLGTAGDRCEHRIDIHVPAFSGNSYMQYIGLRRTVLSFAVIELMFKAQDPSGILFYNGYTTDRSGDFVSLALVDGFLEYRFDLGTGPAVIRSRQPVTMNEWHYVRISRTGRDGDMQIDNQAAVRGMSKGAYTQLTLTLDLFVGGHRNFDEIAKHANLKHSFTGCIQKIVINDRPLKLLEEAINGVNIDNCEHPCVGQPCLNGGRCVPMRDYYKCSCPLGFENTNCEDRKARRELGETIELPMFRGDSYLYYNDPYIMQNVRGKKIEVSMRVRVTEPDGLLFWSSEEDMTSSSDYLALGIRDGHVRFAFNLGSGEVVITYNDTRIDDGNWHKIRAQRYERVGMLEIDSTETVEGTSPGALKQLNTANKLYIGGMDEIVEKTLRKYKSGFVGCISNVTLATDYTIDLIKQAVSGQNIKQCTSS